MRTLSLLQNVSEKIKIFKRQLFKKIILIFFQLSPDLLQTDKSLEPLVIMLSEISHLQNYTVQNLKKGNNSKSIISFFINLSPNILLIILYQLT